MSKTVLLQQHESQREVGRKIRSFVSFSGLEELHDTLLYESGKAGFELRNLSIDLPLQKVSLTRGALRDGIELNVYPMLRAEIYKDQKKIASAVPISSAYNPGKTEVTILEHLLKEVIFDYSSDVLPL